MDLVSTVSFSFIRDKYAKSSSSRRASENLHFFTIRDSSSTIQLISRDSAISEALMKAPLESVVQVEGSVRSRKAKSKALASSSPVSCRECLGLAGGSDSLARRGRSGIDENDSAQSCREGTAILSGESRAGESSHSICQTAKRDTDGRRTRNFAPSIGFSTCGDRNSPTTSKHGAKLPISSAVTCTIMVCGSRHAAEITLVDYNLTFCRLHRSRDARAAEFITRRRSRIPCTHSHFICLSTAILRPSTITSTAETAAHRVRLGRPVFSAGEMFPRRRWAQRSSARVHTGGSRDGLHLGCGGAS